MTGLSTAQQIDGKLRRVKLGLERLSNLPFIPFEVAQPLGDLSDLLALFASEIEALRALTK